MKKDKILLKNDWISVYYSKMHFAFTFGPASYFDNRWHIRTSIPSILSIILFIIGLNIGLGNYSYLFLILFFIPLAPIYLNLPIYSKWDECSPPQYGIAYHGNKFWIYRGGKGNFNGGVKWWTFTMPWDYTWVRTSTLKKSCVIVNSIHPANHEDNYSDWMHETKINRIDIWKEPNKSLKWERQYSYTYKLNNGVVQERIATVGVSEREWRMRFLKWTSLFNKISRTIDIEFNDEVGEKTGSWKGGTLGCGWELLKYETPEMALRRMEKQRRF